MNKKRLSKSVAVAVGIIFLFAVSGLARAESVEAGTVQPPKAAAPEAVKKKDSTPPNDFAGLNYTNEQKAEIAKVHQDMESHKAAVVNDQKLTADQKNAMLLGYTRMEYGRVYQTLSPEQQKQVRQRMASRRTADQAAHTKQHPRN